MLPNIVFAITCWQQRHCDVLHNNNNNNSTFILKERGLTKSYVANYRLFTPHKWECLPLELYFA